VGDVKTGYATIIGKGDKERDIFFDSVAWAAIIEYLGCKEAESERPLFSRHDWKAGSGTPITTNTARSILNRWCRRSRVKTIKPHGLRHRFGKLVTESLGLDKAQDLLGHASPTTTRIYTQNNHNELKGAHETLNL
jgi:site-specific recombinase XerD